MRTSGIDHLIAAVAARALKPHKVSRLMSEPTSDSEGEDALHITVVLAGDDRTISGDRALDAIVDIRQALQKKGENRTAIINFTNEEELASDVDPEPGPSL